MLPKRLLIVSVILNIMLALAIILIINHYTSQAVETKDESAVSKSMPSIATSPSELPAAIENTTEQESVPYYYSDLMVNPIDQAYLPLVTDSSYAQVEFRNFQERYYELWEEEYHKVLAILKSKAVYKEDKEDIEQFDKNVESFFDNNYDFFETAVLGDYDTDPSLPEKNSWGNGTGDKLLEIRGKVYRDACMQLITLLDEEDYHF
jgi:hypothetical protein